MEGVERALSRIPQLRALPRHALVLQPLSGMTNRTYRVSVDGRGYVLRLAGRGTGDYIDRRAEAHNARVAAAAGVNAEVLFFDPEDGTMLTRYIEGVRLDPAALRRDPGSPARVGRLLRRVHGIPAGFRSHFDVFARMRRYAGVLRGLGGAPPAGFDEVGAELAAARAALLAVPVPPAPCHNDPWPRNLLDTATGLCLVDWEYSGSNDPAWDLADVSAEAELDGDQEAVLLEAYCGGPAPRALRGRVGLYRAVGHALWAVWGALQDAGGNPAGDFSSYARERMARAQAALADPGFGRALAATRS
ncbi:MAG: phosphotransferase family protein, partial [Actinomycetota bacterium]|nr:phosphotransferase family protein [Actinomycetota bacterium]